MNLRPFITKENLIYLAGAVIAGMVAVVFRPHILNDDIAISFRYAHRLVQGLGLTYNDHERVLGFSNPLYTLLLASMHYFGVDLESATYWLDVVLLVSSVLMAIHITMKLSNWIGGLFVGLLLSGNFMLYYQGLHGMESILSVLLGLLFITFAVHGRDGVAGVALGLCVWNKLDAGILAIAFLVAWVLIYRAIPFKVIAISILIVLPWMTFATFYYGSPIPHSLQTKYMIHSSGFIFDHFWVLKNLESYVENYILFLLFLPLIVFYKYMATRERLGLLLIIFWLVGHTLTFSLLNFGDYFPWYLTVLSPLIVILGGVSIARLLGRWISKPFSRTAITFAMILVLVCLKIPYWNYVRLNPISSGEAFDNDRRIAGVFVSQYGDSSEVLRSWFGWPAYETNNPFNDKSNLNSIQYVGNEAYVIAHGKLPINQNHSIPTLKQGGFIPLASFNLTSDLFPGHSWFTVFGSSDSKIAKSGKRYLPLRLFELQPSDSATVRNKRIDGTDLIANPPSRSDFLVDNDFQLVRVVFIPSINPRSSNQDTQGIKFQVRSEDSLVFNQSYMQSDNQLKPIMFAIPDSKIKKQIHLSFLTDPEAESTSRECDVRWKNVKVIIGDATIDTNRITDKALRESWLMYNPAN